MDKFLKPISSEAEYDAAVAEIEQYFDDEPAPGTPAAHRFQAILALIKVYDDEHHVIAPPDPIEAIKFRMEQEG